MDNKLRMEENRSSPFTPDNESFLAIATGKRTEMDDITMNSLPGTPIAASTVMRQKGDLEERQAANHKNSRGSLFGSDDPLVCNSKSRSKDSPHFSLSGENIAEGSPAEHTGTEDVPKEKFLASIEENSSENVEEFLRTHNVSGLLQKISLSQTSLTDKPLEARESLMSQTSDTSLGILNLDSMQDISTGITECGNSPEDNLDGENLKLQNGGGTGSTEVQSEAGINRFTHDPSKTSEKTDFRGQSTLDTALTKTNRPDTEKISGMNNKMEGESREINRMETDANRGDNLGANGVTGGGSKTFKGNLKPVENHAAGSSHPHQRSQYSVEGFGVKETGLMGKGKFPQGGQLTEDKETHQKRPRMDHSNESNGSRLFLQNLGSSLKHSNEQHERTGHTGMSRDYNDSAKVSLSDGGVRTSGIVKSTDGERLPSGEMLNRMRSERQFVNPDPAGILPKTPVNQGLKLIIPEENEDEYQIDKASLQAGLDELDALFFDPSPTSKSQRSGSGDGEESRSPSLPQSPQISQNEWQGAQRLLQERPSGQHIRTESQITGDSIDFGDMEDQGNFLQDAFEDVRYSGRDEDNSSEIDTEDEIEAARKELQLEMNDNERPGIEGGSSGEDDQPPPISHLEPRQSAEGVVVVSPIPGDGGGGGDGMSDGESDSGTSMGERSPIRNGISGTERSHDGDGNQDSDGERGSSGDRDVEGQTRTQPVGDGIGLDSATSGRQVRFASHDDVTRWTPSGSAFHSRLRRPRRSVLENGDDSLFPPGSVTPMPTPVDDPSLISSQFLQPSRASVGSHGADVGAEWSQQGDSLVFTQESSHLSQHTVSGDPSGSRLPTQEMEFERTLTPGASASDDLLQVRASSMGSFGLPPTGEDADITFTQRVSFGEDFSLLEAVGGSGSDGSSKRHSTGTDGSSSREETRPARGESVRSSHHSRGSQVVYFDEEGHGMTDLAYRTSLPMMHKLGNVNPFETFDNQEKLEEDIMKDIDFGVEANEEFIPADQVAAVLDADESAFMEENIFRQDENMSAEASKDPSDWTVHEKSHVTIQDNITGSEDFCRISLGTFFRKRTEALGSLSGSSDTNRPTFGCGNLVSPPAREPQAIVNMSDQSRGSDVKQDQSPSYDKRQDGEGGGNEGDGNSVQMSPGRDATLRENKETIPVDSEQSDEEDAEASEKEFSKTVKRGPGSEVEGTETPPLNLSDIAGVIGELSSKANSEEILQKIIALSNKRSISRQGKPERGENTRTREESVTGTSHQHQQSVVNGKDNQSMRKVGRTGGNRDGQSSRATDSVIDQGMVSREQELTSDGRKGSSQRLHQENFSASSAQPNSTGSPRKRTDKNSGGGSKKVDERNVYEMSKDRMPDGDVSQSDYQTQNKRAVSSQGNKRKYQRDSDDMRAVESVRKAGDAYKANKEREVSCEGKVTHGAALNNSQNGSQVSQPAPEVSRKYSGTRTSQRTTDSAVSGMGQRRNIGKFGESEGHGVEEVEPNNWATSSSIHRDNSFSPRRDFFKSSRNKEREILVISPKTYEMEKDHSSGEEEEISPIFGAGMDPGRTGPFHTQFDHHTALSREESEPDGEPNVAGLGTVVSLAAASQSVKSAQLRSNVSQTDSKDSRGRDKQLVKDGESTISAQNGDRNQMGLESQPSNPSLQSDSRESIDGQGMIVVGRHTVKQLSHSMLVNSFNDTLQPSFIRDSYPLGPQTASSFPKQVKKSDAKLQTIPSGTSSQDGITSSSLSSEDEAVHISPSPPVTHASSKILEQEERYNQGLPLSVSTQLGGSRPTSSLLARSGMDGEEAKMDDTMTGRSAVAEILENQGEAHIGTMAYGNGKLTSLTLGQTHQANLIRHASSSLPTLLTSQSLLDTHLTSQMVNSRPGSSLSGGVLDTHLSGHTADSYHLSGGSGASSSHFRPGSSSQSYLGDTLTNLGRRSHLMTQPLSSSNYQDHFRHAQTGLPYQTHWQQSQVPSHGTIGGQGVPSYPPPLFTHAPHESLPVRHLPPNFSEGHHRPPIMSVGIVPNGEPQLSAPHDANLVLPSSMGVPHGSESQHLGYTHHSLPVSSGLGDSLPGSRISNTFGESDLQMEYFRGHRDPLSNTLVLPAHVRFKGVCCVGIASHHSLPLHNSSSRWLHCFLDVVQVTANGEEVPPEGHSTFITKERTTIAPQGTEQVKIIFVPKHPGIYTALLHVGWSTVVPDRDRGGTPHEPPQVVRLQALAEHPNVEVLESKDFHFGEMVYGSAKSKAFHIVNRGRCTVPVRLLVTCTPASLSCFSLSTGDKKSEAVTLSPRGTPASTISPIHISLKGRPDTENDDDLSTASTVWVYFKAPPQLQVTEKMHEAESFSAQMDIEMDVPEKIVTLQSIKLTAVVGVARLHIPRKMNIVNFSATVGKEDCCMLPMKNSGAIKLDIRLSVSRAEDLFSVSPKSLSLKPGEQTSVEIKYAPKEAPSAVESLLIMKTYDDGPKFDMVMRGEGVVEERKTSSKDTPTLFSNKQFVSWGGVAVGRALQQKIVLRNSSSSTPLKLKVSLVGGCSDFQLQSSFGSQMHLSDSKSLILKPEEDLPVNILFAPTSVTSSQGLLVMKPVGGCTKYTVPLSGYGGISSLSIEDLQKVGETSVLPVGNIMSGERKVFTFKVSNHGDRAAFVKVLCFNNLKTQLRLPKTHLSVEPHEFVLPAKGVEQITVVYQPVERDAALCYYQSSMVAVVGFFSGDEIMRTQFRKALRLGHAKDVELSPDNPLKGVLFDKTFLREKQKTEESGLPSRSNDIQLFYSCMSKMMLALVGDASAPSNNSDGVNGIMGNTDMGVNGGAMSHSSINRSDLGLSSPPVKGTPAHMHHNGPGLRLASNGPSGSWSIYPEHLILTWTSDNCRSESTGRIHISNNTERELRFELVWPGHCLTVTPQNGVLQPNDQRVLLVSANPSIHLKGVNLPWSGSVYVSCDNLEKEVRVQIREDLALDTSVLPTSSKQLHSLSHEPSTPAVLRRAPLMEKTSPKELRVKSKVIKCEDACVDQKTVFIFEFENTKKYPMKWNLSSFAPAYLRQADGTVCRTTYSVFRFESTSGEMTPGQKMQLSLHFMPREEGDYSQFWDLESSSTTNLLSHKTRIELSGHGLPRRASFHPDQSSKSIPKQNLYEQALSKQQKLSGSKALDFSKVTKSVTSHHPRETTKTVDSSGTKMIPQRLKESTKKASIVVNELVNFGRCEANQHQTIMVRLKNCSTSPQKVRFVSPPKPFSIKHHEHMIKPRHYLKLPVTFHPTAKGKFQSPLIIETDDQERLAVKLVGECV